MGHNVDLRMFGIDDIKCGQCGKPYTDELEEVDIDCDLKDVTVGQFTLNLQCFKCHENTEIDYIITLVKDSD